MSREAVIVLLLASCGSAPRLPPGYVAVHNTLAARGMVQEGELYEGSVTAGANAQLSLSIEERECRTFVAFAADGASGLELSIVDESGAELARSHGRSPQAAAQLCADRSGPARVIVTGAQGGFLLASWSERPVCEAVMTTGLRALLEADRPCERAAECCHAYVREMGGGPAMQAVDESCENYRRMPPEAEAGCEAALGAWRQGLTAMGREVPVECRP